MKCIIELHFLPLLSTYGLLASYDQVIIEAQENYQKGSFRNKTIIAGPNDNQLLTIPLKSGKHEKTPIQEAEISYNSDWRHTHLRSIQTAYSSAPFYEYYFPAIAAIYDTQPTTLWNFNLDLFLFMNEKLGNSVNIVFSEKYVKNYGDDNIDDFRDRYSPRKNTELCPPFPDDIRYSQVYQDKFGFRSNVSVLDLLFHRGPEAEWVISELVNSRKWVNGD